MNEKPKLGLIKPDAPVPLTPEIVAGEKFCHKIYVPVVIPNQVENRITRVMTLNVETKAAFIPCMKEKCSLWDAEKSQCSELTANLALVEISKYTKKKMAYIPLTAGGQD